MSKFEQVLRLWMAGFGVTSEQADKICSNRRMAANIQRSDFGGVVQDLGGIVFECHLSSECRELLDALNDPGEKLFLIMTLR